MMRIMTKVLIAALLLALCLPAHSATRLKDLGDIDGIRKNQLIGYGLVVGLNGTGDGSGTEFTSRSTANFLQRLGVAVDPDDMNVKNVAAVIVTADLEPFSHSGQRLDVLISSLGDAKSLNGGTLLMTPLRAPNGDTYAVAQGPVAVGGFGAASASGASAQKNHPTTARIPGGAILERGAPLPAFEMGYMDYLLRIPDYTTAARVADVVNARFGEGMASALDAGRVRINLPHMPAGRTVEFFSAVEALSVEPDRVAKVIIDEKTGTVVMGKGVNVLPVAISHGALTIRVAPYLEVSQPRPFSEGETVARDQADIAIEEEDAAIYLMESGESLSTLVDALNALGVSPRELVTIFQALKTAGALEAELVLM